MLIFAAVPEGPDLRNEAAGQRAAGGGGLLDCHRHLEAGVGTGRAGRQPDTLCHVNLNRMKVEPILPSSWSMTRVVMVGCVRIAG